MIAQQTDMKLGKCRWCGDRTNIYRDNRLCADCDSNVIRCNICKEDQHCDNQPCRHVFRDENFEWAGSGCDARSDRMMKPFHRFLSAIGEDFARDLKVAIKSGEFYTWIVAPMIGGGGHLTLYGMAERNWGDKIIDLGESDRAEELHDGYCWLASLHTTNTKIANKTTLKWIDRWLWPLTPEKRL